MKLIIVHYHLRPGGIRRIIELATPHLVKHSRGKIDRVILACGESADTGWHKAFQDRLGKTPVAVFTHPSFNYLSEQTFAPRSLGRQLRAALDELFEDSNGGNCLVWAHNLGVARNLHLSRELSRACAERQIPLAAHHHDWWFDNRWRRWREMQRWGFKSLRAAAESVFPKRGHVFHIAINQTDAKILRQHLPRRSGWLPNLTEGSPEVTKERQRSARQWLRRQLHGEAAPVWILPCRLLRRKNVAEALLLARWLRPEAWLVTTGGVSSADEKPYAQALQAAADRQGWRLRLAILKGSEAGQPGVADLLGVSETVLLTSIQEGFGLPYLEAAAVGRPLIARELPNISPDLQQFGFHFPQLYSEIVVATGLFDWKAERARQQKILRAWQQNLPSTCQKWMAEPILLAAGREPEPVPFSRLTLTAQLEVLAQPLEHSWERCAPLNPFLQVWQRRAARGRLEATPWPAQAENWLSGRAYAKNLMAMLQAKKNVGAPADGGLAIQKEFIRQRLGQEHLFPLLWSVSS